MRVVLALDKFKGTLTAQQANECLAEGIRLRNPKIEVSLRPMADGGDGSAALLAGYLGLEALRVEVPDLYGKATEAHIYWHNSRRVAIVESAEVLGSQRAVAHKSDSIKATSVGLGLLLKKTFDLRPQEIWLAVGGTMTADGGWGLAQAFGLKAQDIDGQDIAPTLADANHISVFTKTELPDYMLKTKILALCDVNAPALGGTTSMADFLPQKGFSASEIPAIQDSLRSYWAQLQKCNPFIPALDAPFTGAGGGLCLGLASVFPNFSMELGAARIAKVAALSQCFQGADLAVCGEGCLDKQTLAGKAPMIVAQTAREHNVRVAGVFGSVEAHPEKLVDSLGLSNSFVITENRLLHSTTELSRLSKTRFHEIGVEIAHIVEAAGKKKNRQQ